MLRRLPKGVQNYSWRMCDNYMASRAILFRTATRYSHQHSGLSWWTIPICASERALRSGRKLMAKLNVSTRYLSTTYISTVIMNRMTGMRCSHLQNIVTITLCYTSGINTHEGIGKATAEALLRSLPHNGTQLYGITIEYVVSCTCYHPVHKCDA